MRGRIRGPAGSRPALCRSQLHPDKPHAGDMADFLLALAKCVGTPRAVGSFHIEGRRCELQPQPDTVETRDFIPKPQISPFFFPP